LIKEKKKTAGIVVAKLNPRMSAKIKWRRTSERGTPKDARRGESYGR